MELVTTIKLTSYFTEEDKQEFAKIPQEIMEQKMKTLSKEIQEEILHSDYCDAVGGDAVEVDIQCVETTVESGAKQL